MARSTLQVRLVTAAAGVATIVATSLLAGCGTGQVAETATVTSSVPGGHTIVKVPSSLNTNSAIFVQNATVDYNEAAGYPKGGDAPLSMWIVNQTPFPVTVTLGPVGITVAGGDGRLTEAGKLGWTDAKHQAERNAPTPAPAPTPSGSGPAGKPSGKPSNSPSSPTDLPTPTPSSAPTGVADVIIAPNGIAMLTASVGPYAEITGLTHALQPGDVVTVGLTFKVDASAELDALGHPTGRGVEEFPATFTAPVAPPLVPGPRANASG